MEANKIVKYHDFVRMVAKDTGFTIDNVREAIRSMEKCICEALSDASPDNIVTVRFFPHGDTTRYYAKPSKRKMPNGTIADAGGRMRTIVRFTPYLQELGWLKEDEIDDEDDKPWYEEDF